jgi:TP901 family phage tail tape measure protein
MSDNKTEWIYMGKDELSAILEKIDSRFNALEESTKKADTAFGKLFDGMAGGLFAFNQIHDAIQTVISGAGSLITPFADYDQKMHELSAITGITGKDLNELGEFARKTGVDFNLGASESVEAFKLLASNIDVATAGGIKGLEELEKNTITLSKAAGVDMPTAANTMAASLNQFHMAASQSADMINVLGAGAKFGAAEIPDLAMSLKETGSVAYNAGVSIESTVGALEVLSQNAIKGGQAGTELRNIITILQSAFHVDLSKQGLAPTLQALGPKLHDVTFLTKAFGRENLNAVQTLISNADAVGGMTAKVTRTNTAFEQAQENMSSFAERVKHGQASIQDFMIEIGERAAPYIETALDKISQGFAWVEANIDTISHVVESLTIGLIAGGTAWLAYNGYLFVTNTLMPILNGELSLMNIIMNANPVGIIVTTIGLLIAGLVLAYKESQTFRAVLAGIGAVAGTLIDCFVGLGKVIAGAFTLDTDLIKEGFEQSAGAIKDVAEKGIGGIFNEGYDQLINDEKAKELKQKLEKDKADADKKNGSMSLMPDGKTAMTKPGKAGPAPTEMSMGIKGVAAGGAKVRNVTINIQKIVGIEELHTNTVKEGATQMADVVNESLVGSIRDAEIASTNNE